MTWTKLSDDYSDDCWSLSDAAFRLHTEGLVWSNRKLLDLRIPCDDLQRFAKRPEAVQELLDKGWWADDAGFYVVKHHAMFQRTREQVVKQQAANSANGARGGRPRKTSLTSASRADGGRRQQTESLSEPVTKRVSDPVSTSTPPESAPVAFPQVKTDSLTDSLSDSKSERDWTGLDRTGTTQLGEQASHAREERPVPSVQNDLGLPHPPTLRAAGAKVIGSHPVPRCECGNVAEPGSNQCHRCAA